MAESTPVIANSSSIGPNDAAYAARADEAARAAEQAKEPAGEFDGISSPETAQKPSEPPAPLAGKFKDAKELEKAYLELQAKLGKQAEPAKAAEESQKAAENLIGPDALTSFVTEFQTNNGLSEESYGKLEKMGLSKAVVDAYIEGQKAVVERQTESVYAQVGGKDAFAEVLKWASQAIPADEQEAFNSIMGSGDIKAASFAMKNLKARFDAENRTPARVEGKATAGSPVGFRSKDEMVSAMTDPRYHRDSTFRREVAMRMAATKFVND